MDSPKTHQAEQAPASDTAHSSPTTGLEWATRPADTGW